MTTSQKIVIPDAALSRRRMLGLAASSAIGVVVSQSLGGCSADAAPTDTDDDGPVSGTVSQGVPLAL